jgi:hypothetical protein
MIVLREQRAVYFGPPKTGSTSMAKFLQEELSGIPLVHPKDHPSKHPRFAQHSRYLPCEYKDHFKFATVRNPYSLMISRFRFRNRKLKDLEYTRMTSPGRILTPGEKVLVDLYENEITPAILQENFESYLIDGVGSRSLRNQSIYEHHHNYRRLPQDCVRYTLDAAIQLERLVEDFNALPFIKKSYDLPFHNRGRKDNSSLGYTQAMEGIMQKIFAQDFIAYDYSKICPESLKLN